jgi:ATP-binding protein involved in chromosome partitioning
MKFAIPLAEGVLCNHFGHCQQFAILNVDGDNVVQKELLTPPPHEPGLLPRWLHGLGVEVIIAGGMGGRALQLFAENGIRVLTGASNLTPEALVQQYLSQTLQTGANVCDH